MINSSNKLAALAPSQPTVAAGTWPRLARRGLKRPRGLWKARRRVDPTTTTTPSSSGCAPPHRSPVPRSMSAPGAPRAQSWSSWRGSETDREEDGSKERESCEEADEDDDDMTSEHSGSSKRQRRESASSSVEMWAFYVDAAEAAPLTTTMTTPLVPCAPPPILEVEVELENSSGGEEGRDGQALIQEMVTTSIAERASRARTKDEYEEWESIKGTLRRASELYDGALMLPCWFIGVDRRVLGEDLSGSITLLRAVVHECHSLLDRFPNPSAFFSQRKRSSSRRGSSSSSSSSEDPVGSSRKKNITIDRMCTCSSETADSGSDSHSSCHHHHRHRRRRHS
jgi:hypothetical protein